MQVYLELVKYNLDSYRISQFLKKEEYYILTMRKGLQFCGRGISLKVVSCCADNLSTIFSRHDPISRRVRAAAIRKRKCLKIIIIAGSASTSFCRHFARLKNNDISIHGWLLLVYLIQRTNKLALTGKYLIVWPQLWRLLARRIFYISRIDKFPN